MQDLRMPKRFCDVGKMIKYNVKNRITHRYLESAEEAFYILSHRLESLRVQQLLIICGVLDRHCVDAVPMIPT
jgi:hypothetical protein